VVPDAAESSFEFTGKPNERLSMQQRRIPGSSIIEQASISTENSLDCSSNSHPIAILL
jgi:hypothetical protein